MHMGTEYSHFLDRVKSLPVLRVILYNFVSFMHLKPYCVIEHLRKMIRDHNKNNNKFDIQTSLDQFHHTQCGDDDAFVQQIFGL